MPLNFKTKDLILILLIIFLFFLYIDNKTSQITKNDFLIFTENYKKRLIDYDLKINEQIIRIDKLFLIQKLNIIKEKAKDKNINDSSLIQEINKLKVIIEER